jgi:two-component system response regulator RpaA
MKVYTVGQAARLCNVAPRTVAKWMDSGNLSGYRLPMSADRRIPHDSLVRFLRQHNMPQAAEVETAVIEAK